jgi:broad specificity phosphatase PhoE
MRKVILIRHAESEANAGKVFPNSNINPLTENGKKQAEELREILDKPDKIFISKYIRTIETAEPTINKYPDVDVHLWVDLHEFSYIDARNLPDMKLEHLLERVSWYWDKCDPEYRDGPTKETFLEFTNRANGLLLKMKSLEKVNYLFTHGDLVKMLHLLLLEFPDFNSRKDEPGLLLKIMERFKSDKWHEFKMKNTEIIDITEILERYNI